MGEIEDLRAENERLQMVQQMLRKMIKRQNRERESTEIPSVDDALWRAWSTEEHIQKLAPSDSAMGRLRDAAEKLIIEQSAALHVGRNALAAAQERIVMLNQRWDAMLVANTALGERLGWREGEGFVAFVERLAKERDEARSLVADWGKKAFQNAEEVMRLREDLLAVAQQVGIVHQADGHDDQPGPTPVILRTIAKTKRDRDEARETLEVLKGVHCKKVTELAAAYAEIRKLRPKAVFDRAVHDRAAQAGEVIGETCIDGAKCHHGCVDKCWRRRTCSPLSGYHGPWDGETAWETHPADCPCEECCPGETNGDDLNGGRSLELLNPVVAANAIARLEQEQEEQASISELCAKGLQELRERVAKMEVKP